MNKMLLMIFCIIFTSNAYCQFSFDLVSLTGKVTNLVNNEPVKVTIVVVDKKGEIVSTTESDLKKGYYFISELSPGESYTLKFSAAQFLKQAFELSMPKSNKYEEFSHDFQLIPKKKGEFIQLKVSPFELNKTKLRAGSETFLKDIIKVLKDNPDVKFNISSYPDNDLDKKRNKELTIDRGNSIKDFFIENGIDAVRISLSFYEVTDKRIPPPAASGAKGKRYVGPIYLKVE